MRHTKSFREYTEEEKQECLTECYVALVTIQRILKGQEPAIKSIDQIVAEALDKMFTRTIDDTSENRS